MEKRTSPFPYCDSDSAGTEWSSCSIPPTPLDLFTPIVGPELEHPNFATVARRLNRPSELAVVRDWADGFPDRDGKFVQEFQRTFNSSFWEVYLHGVFKSYGFTMDWTHARPDFWLGAPQGQFIVEAVTANEAAGTDPEWERSAEPFQELAAKNFWPLNRRAIIRLSNALLGKVRKYNESYRLLPHVPRKPFVIAVAPFEQPFFNHQYDRPIQALLYDHYVDETAYFKDRNRYPDGPPSVSLGSVSKDNGAEIEMGLFNDDRLRQVSAVIFSCVATWGKVVAMSTGERAGIVSASWGVGELGVPQKRNRPVGVPS